MSNTNNININNINERETKNRRAHQVIMLNKRQMTVSGVIRVENFNDNTIVVITEFGTMTIEGASLHISKLSLETGEVNIDGELAGLFYSGGEFDTSGKKSSALFGKLFK